MPELPSDLPGGRDYLLSTLTARLAYARVESLMDRFTIGPYYVQWGSASGALQVEVVSDRFLDKAHQIGPFGAGRMRRLGFRSPTPDAPNWTMIVTDVDSAFAVAQGLVTALLDVYRVNIAELVVAVGALPGPDIPQARPLQPVESQPLQEGAQLSGGGEPARVPEQPMSPSRADRTLDDLRRLCDVMVDQVAREWVTSEDIRGLPALTVNSAPGLGLPWTATVDVSGILEVVTSLGDFLLSDSADLALAAGSSALVELVAVEQQKVVESDGRARGSVVARTRIDLEVSPREVPLRTVAAAGRRQAVAFLLQLLEGEGHPDDPYWLGSAAFPDALALASLLAPDVPGDLPDEVYSDIVSRFARAGLGHPWVPADCAGALVTESQWVWSAAHETASGVLDPMHAYLFAPAVQTVMADWTPRFHVSHAGHGVNSYGLSYVWVGPRASVVAQTALGGVYMDEATTTARARFLAADLALFESLARDVAHWPGERARWVVWASDLRGARGWAWPIQPVDGFTPNGTEHAYMEGHSDALKTGIGPAVSLLEDILADELGLESSWAWSSEDTADADDEDDR